MTEKHNYQMAVDLLCCHLGISEDEAKQQLGIKPNEQKLQNELEVQASLIAMNEHKCTQQF